MAAIPTIRTAVPLAVRASLLILTVAAAPEAAAAAQETPSSGPRVRTTSTVIRTAIALGIERSPTFRQRLAEIEATDGLVYVDEGICRHSPAAACLAPSLVLAGPFRLLRVFVDVRKATGCRLVATIGHELHHAGEVLQDPSIRSGDAVFFLFARIGPVASGSFETAAAKLTSLHIDREVCRD